MTVVLVALLLAWMVLLLAWSIKLTLTDGTTSSDVRPLSAEQPDRKCGLCKFASADMAAFTEHMRSVHNWGRREAPKGGRRLGANPGPRT